MKLLVPLLLSLHQLLNLNICHAAHSNKRHTFVRSYQEPKSSQYDRSITIFSDEGRLLQVEYAIEASSRGKSVICLNFNSTMICSAIVTEEGYSEDDDEEDLMRLHPQEEKIHRIDNNCFLITTGLSGDGRALAHTSRLVCQRLRREVGDHNEHFTSTIPIREIAESISDMQHELTRTSGARPFGVSATILGMDKTTNELHLYQSEAGGIVEEYDFCSSGKNRDLLQGKLKDLWLVLLDTEEEEVLKERMILGLANILFENVEKVNCIDVWFMKKNTNARGGMDIQCAKSVTRDQVSGLHTYF